MYLRLSSRYVKFEDDKLRNEIGDVDSWAFAFVEQRGKLCDMKKTFCALGSKYYAFELCDQLFCRKFSISIHNIQNWKEQNRNGIN